MIKFLTFFLFSIIQTLSSTLSPSCVHELVHPQIYDKSLSPARLMTESHATAVFIEMYIESISSIEQKSMDYDIDFYFRSIWTDHRLIFSGNADTPLGTNELAFEKKLWKPDLYFSSAKTATYLDVTVPNMALWLFPNGSIHSSRRIQAKMSCFMNLAMFPSDTQVCSIMIKTYSSPKRLVNVNWSKGDKSIMLSPEIQMTDFEITKVSVDTCDGYYEGYGLYNCLLANLTLTRYSGYFFHQIQIVMPTAMIVVVSWIGFWISPGAISARAVLSIITFLVLTTQSIGLRSSLPQVAYVTAVDVWTMICRVFVFASLIEFSIAYYYYDGKEKNQYVDNFDYAKDVTEMVPKVTCDLMPATVDLTISILTDALDKKLIPQEHPSWLTVDRSARIIFPISFLMANIVFWLAYPPTKFS